MAERGRWLNLMVAVLCALGSGRLGAQPQSEADNDSTAPITFYGRVVDQDGNPLPSVRVEMEVLWWTNSATGESGFSRGTAVATDADGNFQFRGGEGRGIWIRALKKEGYEPERAALRSFRYNVPSIRKPDDPAKPLVFRMWKEGTDQNHATGSFMVGLSPDGRSRALELYGWPGVPPGKAIENLRLRFTRNVDAKPERKFDWSFVLEADEGGILEERDEFATMYLAPAEGYLPKYEFRMESGNPKWVDRVKKRFYFRDQAGTAFGRVTLVVFTFYKPESTGGTVGCDYVINKVGGRVLRYP